MTLEERISLCEKCTLREHTEEDWIVCSLTGKLPEFEESCPDFNLDEYEAKAIEEFRKEPPKENEVTGYQHQSDKILRSGFYVGLIAFMLGILILIVVFSINQSFSTFGIILTVAGGGTMMKHVFKKSLHDRDTND